MSDDEGNMPDTTVNVRYMVKINQALTYITGW
jgi:hypothetical protein